MELATLLVQIGWAIYQAIKAGEEKRSVEEILRDRGLDMDRIRILEAAARERFGA